MGRRAISLSLPPSDPRSATIAALLDALPAGADRGAVLRALIVAGLDAPRAAGLEDRIDQLAAEVAALAELLRGGTALPPTPPEPPPADDAQAAQVATLLSF